MGKIIVKWFIGFTIVLVIVLILYLVPKVIELLTYPDARIKNELPNDASTKLFNARRAKNMRSGINLGCALQAPNEGDWGLVLTESDFDAVQRAGFNYIRVPVQFLPHLSQLKNAYRLDLNLLSRLDWVIKNILKRDMTVIVDFHYVIPDDKLFFKSPEDTKQCEEKFLAVWRILADRYKDYPASLYFELANEPHRAITPDIWNTFVQKALEQIRQSGGNNSTRTVVVATNVLIGWFIHTWDQIHGIKQLKLPSTGDDPNIMVTFHYYNPYPFTHQGETYTDDLALISRIWQGNKWMNTDKQMSYVRKDFNYISQWAQKNKRKIILGEFGVSITADINSQVRWTKFVREEAESRGMIWIFWQLHDVGTLGVLYNQTAGYWRKEILDALLPGEK